MKKAIIALTLFVGIIYGCSTNSNNTGGSTTTIVPVAPSNLTGNVLSSSSVSLTWVDNSTNESGFKIERRLNGAVQFSVVGNVNADVTSFVDSNLVANTSYEYRVYSFNAVGSSITYSNVIVLTTNNSGPQYSYTLGPSVIDIEGNLYPSIVTSCGQTWTSKNLNVSRYRNGDIIPEVTDATEWENLTTGAWCWYNNDSATFASVYGKLYNWYAVNDPRGIAPSGWHIPSETEWNNLIYCIDPAADTLLSAGYNQISDFAGGAMKDTGTQATSWFNWYSVSWNGNGGATNNIGFTALPGGERWPHGNPGYNGGQFGEQGSNAVFWSSTETNATWALGMGLEYFYPSIGFLQMVYNPPTINYRGVPKTMGFSVRLVKD